MSCDSGLYGDSCCLTVSDLSYHDDIRILTKDRSEGCRESHVRFVINLHLIDTVDVRLDRVLNGDDINILCVKLTE